MLSFLGLSGKGKGDGSPEPTPTPTPKKAPAVMGYNKGKPLKEDKPIEDSLSAQSTSHSVPLLSLPTQPESIPNTYKLSASMSISDSDSDKDNENAMGRDHHGGVKFKHAVIPLNPAPSISSTSVSKSSGHPLRSGALLDEDSVNASVFDQASVDVNELDRNARNLSLQSMTDDGRTEAGDPTKHTARSHASSTTSKHTTKTMNMKPVQTSYNEDDEEEEEEEDPNALPMRVGSAFPHASTVGTHPSNSTHSKQEPKDEELPSLKGMTMPDRNKHIDIWRLQTAIDRKEFWVSIYIIYELLTPLVEKLAGDPLHLVAKRSMMDIDAKILTEP